MANALQQSNVCIVVYNSIFLSDFMLIITRYTHIVKVKTLNKHSESGFCKTKRLFSNEISNYYANVKKSKLT